MDRPRVRLDFTGRGQRLLEAGVGDKNLGAFIVPLPAHPGSAEQQWSDWLPHAASGQPPLPDQVTYRFRVARTSEPLRTIRVGGFEIQTSQQRQQFLQRRGLQRLVKVPDPASRAAPGWRRRGRGRRGRRRRTTALLVERLEDGQPDGCAFITDGAERPTVAPIGPCTMPMELQPLTSDQAVFIDARDARRPTGWVDWHTLKQPGLFLLNDHVVDTRSLTFRTFTRTLEPYPASMPPLVVSPDERSFAWFAHDGSEDKPVLGVTSIAASRSYTVPIDRGRMRFNEYHKLDPAWVAHHFEWRRGPDGADVLAARETFGPLPYRGDLTLGKPGEFMSYTVRPGGEKLRSAIVGLLLSEMKGERLPDRLDGYEQRVRVDGKLLLITIIETSNYCRDCQTRKYKTAPSKCPPLPAERALQSPTGDHRHMIDDESLVRSFEAGEEPAGGFHHAQHVRVAWWYLRQHPWPEALARFGAALRRFAAAQGKPNLFHETVTTAFVLVINKHPSMMPTARRRGLSSPRTTPTSWPGGPRSSTATTGPKPCNQNGPGAASSCLIAWQTETLILIFMLRRLLLAATIVLALPLAPTSQEPERFNRRQFRCLQPLNAPTGRSPGASTGWRR